MALQNIGAGNSDDAFYRYKMPKMITKIEGRGNGIKTNVVNMVDIAKALARPASYTTKYFGCELGAQSKFDEKTGTSLVNGAHDTPKLAGLLENFIKKYVQCYGCGNPETEILITKTQMLQLKCAACGFVSDVDMRDKLTTFILKNPPEQKKGSKDKKAMRRAEKERLKEGEAADEEMKKIKKESKKKGTTSSKDGTTKASSSKKKASGSDEDRTSPTHSQVDEKEEADEDEDDDIQWQTDTSLEAAKQRIQEQLSAVTADMVMLSTEEMEKKPKGFKLMTEKYDIEMEMEHYGCMVDLLSRAGFVDEAVELIEKMQAPPDPVLWATLLGACKIHGSVELGERIGNKLIQLDPTYDGHYVQLAGIYAKARKWEDVVRVRRLMVEQNTNKVAGWSLIEAQGRVHQFVAGDREHERSLEIYNMLETIGTQIAEAGYSPKISSVLHDIGEEEKENVVKEHSERLAIAYGMLVTKVGDCIRIVKNLRVCEDCHEASKMISKVFDREIIVRDYSRFHHFKEGKCSCLDYW